MLSGCGVSKENEKEDAVAAIIKLGGKVTYDEKTPGKPLVGVDLRDSKATDASLVHLNGLKNLQTLNLFGTGVTDTGLVHLKGLTNQRRLALANLSWRERPSICLTQVLDSQVDRTRAV